MCAETKVFPRLSPPSGAGAARGPVNHPQDVQEVVHTLVLRQPRDRPSVPLASIDRGAARFHASPSRSPSVIGLWAVSVPGSRTEHMSTEGGSAIVVVDERWPGAPVRSFAPATFD